VEVEQLEVTKTADTSFIRTHDWSIEKTVDPDTLYLYADGSGDATVDWEVTVTYEGYIDSGHNVSGTITIDNVGNTDAVITSVVDELGDAVIDVSCEGVDSFPYTLLAGGTLICTYDEDGEFEGFNEVTVTTGHGEYFADAEIIWGDPDEDIHATVEITDTNDTGGVLPQTLNAYDYSKGDTEVFTYSKDFGWADYEDEAKDCEECVFYYDNTAQVIGDGGTVLDEADARLAVYVQCLVFNGETAWAANGDTPGSLRYPARGNWATYVE
jgi:hypothetical protein